MGSARAFVPFTNNSGASLKVDLFDIYVCACGGRTLARSSTSGSTTTSLLSMVGAILKVFSCKDLKLYCAQISVRSYLESSQLDTVGGYLCRPWQLPHRMDYGLRGTSDIALSSSLLHF